MGKKILMKDNEALAEATVRVGCRLYCGYPITPQTEIMEYLSDRMPQVGGSYIIVDVCRYGSGLGLISPEQGDYFQATKGGGHGDYQLPVFAPHTIQESVDLIALAFDKAEEYLTPVILLTDGALGQRMGGDVALAVHGEKPVYLMPTGMTPSKEQKILEMVQNILDRKEKEVF